MVSSAIFGLLAAWACLLVGVATSAAVSGPAPLMKKTVSVSAADGVFKGRVNGVLEYYRTLSKYNIAIPDELQHAANRHLLKLIADQGTYLARTSIPPDNVFRAAANMEMSGGSTAASSNGGDLEFTAPASVGTPAQLLNLDFDTGSADTWVFSNDTKTSHNQTSWDISKSSTARRVPNCTWSIMYGDFSSSSGLVYRDTFALGNLSIPNMTIESAGRVSAGFSKMPEVSGLVGLAFGKIIQTVPPQKALLDFLPDFLDESVFTTDLRHNSSEGTYNFGYIDPDLNGSEFQYLGIDTSDGFWALNFYGFSINGSSDEYEPSSPQPVILDTGSTLMYAPDEVVQQYYKSVPGSNFSMIEYGWTLPCDVVPPDFIWELSDSDGNVVQGAIPGQYFIYAVLEEKGVPNKTCYSGLQSLGGGTVSGLTGILGDVFLKSSVQVWDIGQARVGFASKKDPSTLGLNGYNTTGSDDGSQKPQGGYGGHKMTTRVVL